MSFPEGYHQKSTGEHIVGNEFIETEQELDFLEKGGYYTNMLTILREISKITITDTFREILLTFLKNIQDELEKSTSEESGSSDSNTMIDRFTSYLNRVFQNRDQAQLIEDSLLNALEALQGKKKTISSTFAALIGLTRTMIKELSTTEEITLLHLLEYVIQDLEKIGDHPDDAISQSVVLSSLFPHGIELFYKEIIVAFLVGELPPTSSIQENIKLIEDKDEAERTDQDVTMLEKYQKELLKVESLNSEFEEKILPKILQRINQAFGVTENREELLHPLRKLYHLLSTSQMDAPTVSSYIDCMGKIRKNMILFLLWFEELDDLIPLLKMIPGDILNLFDTGNEETTSTSTSPYTSIGKSLRETISDILSIRNIFFILFPYIQKPAFNKSLKEYLQSYHYILADGTRHKPFVTLASSSEVKVNSTFSTAYSLLPSIIVLLERGTQEMLEQLIDVEKEFLNTASQWRPLIPYWDFDYPILRYEEIPWMVTENPNSLLYNILPTGGIWALIRKLLFSPKVMVDEMNNPLIPLNTLSIIGFIPYIPRYLYMILMILVPPVLARVFTNVLELNFSNAIQHRQYVTLVRNVIKQNIQIPEDTLQDLHKLGNVLDSVFFNLLYPIGIILGITKNGSSSISSWLSGLFQRGQNNG